MIADTLTVVLRNDLNDRRLSRRLYGDDWNGRRISGHLYEGDWNDGRPYGGFCEMIGMVDTLRKYPEDFTNDKSNLAASGHATDIIQ